MAESGGQVPNKICCCIKRETKTQSALKPVFIHSRHYSFIVYSMDFVFPFIGFPLTKSQRSAWHKTCPNPLLSPCCDYFRTRHSKAAISRWLVWWTLMSSVSHRAHRWLTFTTLFHRETGKHSTHSGVTHSFRKHNQGLDTEVII